MVDTLQFALFFILVILTILVVILGVQVFLILKDFKRTVLKFNKILDDAGVVSEAISRPVGAFSTLTTSIKAGSTIVKIFKKVVSAVDRKEQDGETKQ
ncbi:MAG: hypothetical protein HYT11_02860 [Candidatus Levybacteria bacterium]|nr:hypothetical protein [Candidatus Levybacteria bacterium]